MESKYSSECFCELTQDQLEEIQLHSAACLTTYRQLIHDALREVELSTTQVHVNQLNQQLFKVFCEMLGKNQEHASIVQSFFTCTPLTVNLIHKMTAAKFNQMFFHQFVGFKSNMTPEAVEAALDGELPEGDRDMCQTEEQQFATLYWTEIWRNVQNNYYQTRLCTDLDPEILDKLAISNAEQVRRLTHAPGQTFSFSLSEQHILAFDKNYSDSGEIDSTMIASIRPMSYKPNKNKNKPGKLSASRERIRAEDQFLNDQKVLIYLQRYHALCQGDWGLQAHKCHPNYHLLLSDVPTVIDWAAHYMREAKDNPEEHKKYERAKRKMAAWLSKYSISRTLLRLLTGLPDSVVRSFHEKGAQDNVCLEVKMPDLNTSRVLWDYLAGQFVVQYGKLVGSDMKVDMKLDAVIAVWLRMLQFYDKSPLSMFLPYVIQLGLFCDIALKLREDALPFSVCPHCGTIYIDRSSEALEKSALKSKTTVPTVSEDDFDPAPTGPYCSRLMGLKYSDGK